MTKTFLVALVAGACALLSRADITIAPSSRNFEVTFNGNSGSFKLYLNSNGSNTFYNIAYRDIQEVTSSGTSLGNQRNLDLGSNVAWTQTSGAGYVAVEGVAQGTIASNPVRVTIANNLTSVNTEVVVANNVTIPLIANTLKVAIMVEGWSVQTAGNLLRLHIKMSSNSKRSGSSEDINPDIQSAGSGKQKVQLAADGTYSAQILFEQHAYTVENGNWISHPVALSPDTTHNQQYINLPANTNGDTVFWDPTIVVVPNSATAYTLSIAAVVLAALAAVMTAA